MRELMHHYKLHDSVVYILLHCGMLLTCAAGASKESEMENKVAQFEREGEVQLVFEIIRSRFYVSNSTNTYTVTNTPPDKKLMAEGARIAVRLLMAVEDFKESLDIECEKAKATLLFFIDEMKRRTDQPFIRPGITRPEEIEDPAYRQQYQDFIDAQSLVSKLSQRSASLKDAHRSLSEIVSTRFNHFTKDEQEKIRQDAIHLRLETLKENESTDADPRVPPSTLPGSTIYPNAPEPKSVQTTNPEVSQTPSSTDKAPRTSPMPTTLSEESALLTPWIFIVLLIASTLGLLWLLLKRRS